MLADAPAALRDRVAAMQRRAFEVQAAAGAVTEAQDPVEAHPEALGTLEIPARRGTRFEPRLGLPAGAPAVVQRLLVCFSSVVAWLHGHLRC